MDEKIRFDERVIWYKKKIQAINGRLLMTDQRISFTQDIIEPPFPSAIGRFLYELKRKRLNDGKVFNYALDKVSFSKGKSMGKKTYLIEITTSDNKVFKFMWDDKLQSKMIKIINSER